MVIHNFPEVIYQQRPCPDCSDDLAMLCEAHATLSRYVFRTLELMRRSLAQHLVPDRQAWPYKLPLSDPSDTMGLVARDKGFMTAEEALYALLEAPFPSEDAQNEYTTPWF